MNKKLIYVFVTFICVALIISLCFIFVNKNSRSAYLKISSDSGTIEGIYRVGDTFECSITGEDFILRIDNITDKKVKISSSKKGLCEVNENGTISLTGTYKHFELYKGKALKLTLQAHDVFSGIDISWE